MHVDGFKNILLYICVWVIKWGNVNKMKNFLSSLVPSFTFMCNFFFIYIQSNNTPNVHKNIKDRVINKKCSYSRNRKVLNKNEFYCCFQNK